MRRRVDNDGDGHVDWQRDLGCYGPADATEAAGPREDEDGFTTFEIEVDSVVAYVSAEGDDEADGSTPETAVASLARAAELVRDGEHDFILLRRGDTWRGQSLGRFKSGRDAAGPLVVAGYGDSTELPRLEIDDHLIDHDGQSRSFVALIGLHLVAYRLDPADPEFDGVTGGGLRYVGNGEHLLIEGCHLEYGEIVVQSIGDALYTDVEVRRNVVEKSYHAGTCPPGNPNGDPTHRPSGMYSSHVDRLTIEGNLFDHNGWNQDVEDACATIYNHNLYLNGNDVIIRDNLLTRASSIHIKLRSDVTGDMDGLVVDNNYFVEGEIGISLGGNSDEPFRFSSSTIRRNVLSDLGRTRPTTRTLAWGIGVSDNDGLVIESNHFLNQHEEAVGNSWALNIGGGTERDVTVADNLFYRIQGRSLRVKPAAGHESIAITGNDFVDPDQGSCLIDHNGAFAAYAYAENTYFSSAPADEWFCLDTGREPIETWQTRSGETDATAIALPALPDPDRTVETYAATLGLDPPLESFLAVARQQSRFDWRRELTAPFLNDYIRAGFE